MPIANTKFLPFKLPDFAAPDFERFGWQQFLDAYYVSRGFRPAADVGVPEFDTKHGLILAGIVQTTEELHLETLTAAGSCESDFVFRAQRTEQMVSGQVLRVIRPATPGISIEKARQEIEEYVSDVRLACGPSAALRRLALLQVTLPDYHHIQFTLESSTIELGVNWENDWLYTALQSSGLYSLPIKKMKEDTHLLLTAAFEQKRLDRRFAFLWMAVEKEVGDGHSRKNFCESVLQSEEISRELRRLHRVHSEYFHEGRGSVDELGAEAFLIAVFRLRLSDDSSAFRSFISLIEEKLRSGGGCGSMAPTWPHIDYKIDRFLPESIVRSSAHSAANLRDGWRSGGFHAGRNKRG